MHTQTHTVVRQSPDSGAASPLAHRPRATRTWLRELQGRSPAALLPSTTKAHPRHLLAFSLLSIFGLASASAQVITGTITQSICQTNQITTGSFSQASPGADAQCVTTTQWPCGDGILGACVVTLGPTACPGISLAGILDPWLGQVVLGPTTLLVQPLTYLGCAGAVESWQHTLSIPASVIPPVPGISFNVQHVLLINNGPSGPVSWFGADNALEFTLASTASRPLIAWGVPPAHVYENDGRSTGSAIRIPVLAYRHANDGDITRVVFILTKPDGSQQTQTVLARTTETPTASTSGSPFVSSPADQQSKLTAFYFTANASTLGDGLHRLQADAIDTNGTSVLTSIADMSFWNNWGGTAITYVEGYVDFGTGTTAQVFPSVSSPAKTIHHALDGYLSSLSQSGGKVSVKTSNTGATFFRIHLRGTAKQSWGGRSSWYPSFGTDVDTWLEIIGEGATPDGNVLIQEPTNQAGGAGGVSIGYNEPGWVHFRNVTIDDDWGLDYANGSFDTRGWYDKVTMQPGIYGNPANPPHIKAVNFRQGLNGFKWNYGTNITYNNVLDVGTFNLGSDIIVQGALMQSAGRFADSTKPYVHWGVQIPAQISKLGEVTGTCEPFNSWDWPWNQAPYIGIPVTATVVGANLRVSIPSTAPQAAQFLAAAQALVGLTRVGFKIRHANSLYTQQTASPGLNDGDWEVVGAGTLGSGDPYVDLDLSSTTPVAEVSNFVTLKATHQMVGGSWDPNGFDPHPDILELQLPSPRSDVAPPIIVQGFRAYDVRNAQLLFTHGSDLVNTAFVNCSIGVPANGGGVLNTGASVFRMRNFIMRNCYIPGAWSLQFGTGTFDYRHVEVTNNILYNITGTVPGSSPSITGHFLFQSNRFEDPGLSFTGAHGQLDNSSYTFTWSSASRGTIGDFSNTCSLTGLGPWGFAIDGSNTGS